MAAGMATALPSAVMLTTEINDIKIPTSPSVIEIIPTPFAALTEDPLHTAIPEDTESERPNTLLSLPAEIRNTIYRLLLVSPLQNFHRRLLATNHCSPYILPDWLITLSCAILSTCRQIHTEATPILYGLNTFTASSTRLTRLPFFTSPSNPIRYSSVTQQIRKWYINVRLDCDAQFTEEQCTASFTGCEELEIEASQAMFRAAGNAVLMLFSKVRGVGIAKVGGSVDDEVARWLEAAMMLPLGVSEDVLGGLEGWSQRFNIISAVSIGSSSAGKIIDSGGATDVEEEDSTIQETKEDCEGWSWPRDLRLHEEAEASGSRSTDENSTMVETRVVGGRRVLYDPWSHGNR